MNLLSRGEELVLLSVWRLQGEAYGATIRNHLVEATEEDWSIGVVYQSLDRLARQGLLKTRVGEPTPERGGRSKRFFELTQAGVSALTHVRSVQNSMWGDLPALSSRTSNPT